MSNPSEDVPLLVEYNFNRPHPRQWDFGGSPGSPKVLGRQSLGYLSPTVDAARLNIRTDLFLKKGESTRALRGGGRTLEDPKVPK